MPLQVVKSPGSLEPPKAEPEMPVVEWEGEGGQIPGVPTAVADGNQLPSPEKTPKALWRRFLRQWVKRLRGKLPP